MSTPGSSRHAPAATIPGGTGIYGLNLILLFDLVNLNRVTARDIKAILRSYEETYPHPYLPTYALGNHDCRRYMSRIGGDAALARLLAFFLYTARGRGADPLLR
jgi:glycosidase